MTAADLFSAQAKTRQGQCDACKTGWTWLTGIRLRDQRCPSCGGPLKQMRSRVLGSAAARAASGYTWMGVEGYRPAPVKAVTS